MVCALRRGPGVPFSRFLARICVSVYLLNAASSFANFFCLSLAVSALKHARRQKQRSVDIELSLRGGFTIRSVAVWISGGVGILRFLGSITKDPSPSEFAFPPLAVRLACCLIPVRACVVHTVLYIHT